MSEQLAEKLSRLRELAPRLNTETDRAAAAVRVVEVFLADLSVGVEAEALFKTDPVERNNLVRYWSDCYLAYKRTSLTKQFRVCVVVKERGVERGAQPVVTWEDVWENCPRGVKLASFRVLPELLAAVTEKADKLAALASEASTAVGNLPLFSRPEGQPGQGRYP